MTTIVLWNKILVADRYHTHKGTPVSYMAKKIFKSESGLTAIAIGGASKDSEQGREIATEIEKLYLDDNLDKENVTRLLKDNSADEIGCLTVAQSVHCAFWLAGGEAKYPSMDIPETYGSGATSAETVISWHCWKEDPTGGKKPKIDYEEMFKIISLVDFSTSKEFDMVTCEDLEEASNVDTDK